jgi:ribosomal protein L21
MAVGLLLCLQVIIYKMKAKKHYRRTTGHRQPLSKILITSIAA